MSSCIVCGKPQASPPGRVSFIDGQWVEVRPGPPVCLPECDALESVSHALTPEERQQHDWEMAGRRGQPPRSKAARHVEATLTLAAMGGSQP